MAVYDYVTLSVSHKKEYSVNLMVDKAGKTVEIAAAAGTVTDHF